MPLAGIALGFDLAGGAIKKLRRIPFPRLLKRPGKLHIRAEQENVNGKSTTMRGWEIPVDL